MHTPWRPRGTVVLPRLDTCVEGHVCHHSDISSHMPIRPNLLQRRYQIRLRDSALSIYQQRSSFDDRQWAEHNHKWHHILLQPSLHLLQHALRNKQLWQSRWYLFEWPRCCSVFRRIFFERVSFLYDSCGVLFQFRRPNSSSSGKRLFMPSYLR